MAPPQRGPLAVEAWQKGAGRSPSTCRPCRVAGGTCRTGATHPGEVVRPAVVRTVAVVPAVAGTRRLVCCRGRRPDLRTADLQRWGVRPSGPPPGKLGHLWWGVVAIWVGERRTAGRWMVLHHSVPIRREAPPARPWWVQPVRLAGPAQRRRLRGVTLHRVRKAVSVLPSAQGRRVMPPAAARPPHRRVSWAASWAPRAARGSGVPPGDAIREPSARTGPVGSRRCGRSSLRRRSSGHEWDPPDPRTISLRARLHLLELRHSE